MPFLPSRTYAELLAELPLQSAIPRDPEELAFQISNKNRFNRSAVVPDAFQSLLLDGVADAPLSARRVINVEHLADHTILAH
jgi:hypothetical protein